LAPTAGGAGEAFGMIGVSSAALAGIPFFAGSAGAAASAFGAAAAAFGAAASAFGAAASAFGAAAGALSSPKLDNYMAEVSPIRANTANVRIVLFIFIFYL